MLDFSLTDEQLSAAEMVKDFAEREVYPTIKEYDRKQEMNPSVLPRMAELGILGINIPVRYGGQGFDYVTLGLVCEELERVDSTLRVVMSVHVGLNSLGEAAFPDAAGARREIRGVLPDGAGCRLRRGFDALHGAP